MTFRSPALLRLAAKAPHCMAPGCRAQNVGQVVAAHSNQMADGKGMGTQASDAAIAFCCDQCHSRIDLRRCEDPLYFWEAAHRATMRWLVESGHLAVVAEPAPYVAPPKKPSKKIAKGRPLQSDRKLQSRAEWPEGRKLQGGRPFPSSKARTA